MRIVEISDYSMMVMRDSEDPPWVTVGDVYRRASKGGYPIMVDIDQLTFHYRETSDYIYTAGRLILYFKEKITDKFSLHDRVCLVVNQSVLYNNYRKKQSKQ